MSLKLYLHPLSSYCHKVLIALYENGSAFTQITVNLGDEDDKARFTALWPTAKIPLLEDERCERIVPETSIMIEYVDRHYPNATPLLPTQPDACLEARLWDRLFDLYIMTPMQQIVADRLRAQGERDALNVAQAKSTLQMAYDMIDRQVRGKTWAIGEAFTIADCAAAPALFYAHIVQPFSTQHTELNAYFERLVQRPSVARAIDEARPYFQYFPYKDAMPARFLTGTASASSS